MHVPERPVGPDSVSPDLTDANQVQPDEPHSDLEHPNPEHPDPGHPNPGHPDPGHPDPPNASADPNKRSPHIIDENSANDMVELDLLDGFAQQVDWGVVDAPTIVIDEPEPLGTNRGPSPARVLAAALGSCLAASLLFCLRKSRIDVHKLHTTASVELKRNDKGRLRVGTITVRLEPVVALEQQHLMVRCIEVFEDYCIVTASVRPTVTVNVSVHPVSPPAH